MVSAGAGCSRGRGNAGARHADLERGRCHGERTVPENSVRRLAKSINVSARMTSEDWKARWKFDVYSLR
eukprot:9495823-Pyramimonas_sp.AAC.1